MIITYSYMVHFALKAAEILAREGIDVEALDLCTIKRIASPDCPAPFSPELEAYVLPSVNRIADEIRSMF